MNPGIYRVTYTPYWNTSAKRTETVMIDEAGKWWVKSPFDGQFKATKIPYEGEGYEFEEEEK